LTEIEEKLKRTPLSPGVYLLKDKQGQILYVGKAKQLRNRLRSHFKPGKNEEPRHNKLMQKVRDFETILTDSEVEALIMEANFVKAHRPRYNIDLKDDKSYPYIRITNESFPRIFSTRKLVHDGSRYFGPYTDAGALRQLMQALRKIFPLRTCTRSLHETASQNKKGRECLNYHIGRCNGACSGRVNHDEYLKMISNAIAFIKGEDNNLIRELKKLMAERAAGKRYEEAAALRDEIKSITAFRNRQKVVDPEMTDRDLISVFARDGEACGLVFNVREGKIINRQHYFLNNTAETSVIEMVGAFVKQFYLKDAYVPAEIFLQVDLPELSSLEKWLGEKKGRHVKISVPKIGRKAKLMDMCKENARHLLDGFLVQKKAGSNRIAGSVESLQKNLCLDSPPLRIEAFDISNTQGEDSVASLVVFENGQPRKSEYRKFKIKTVYGADDFASMAEVLGRRVKRLLKEEKTLPDLFLVDGGKGQLSAAVKILEQYGIQEQPIIGLAKKLEEVFLPGLSDPQNIPKHSPGLHLLQRIRDESHRFAVTFHRQLRRKRSFHSELDDIKGVGQKRRLALLKAFGSLDKIRQATTAELAAVDGMNSKIAKVVERALNDQK